MCYLGIKIFFFFLFLFTPFDYYAEFCIFFFFSSKISIVKDFYLMVIFCLYSHLGRGLFAIAKRIL